MQTNFIKDLLGFKDVILKNMKNFKDHIEIYLDLPVSEQICPRCGSKTSTIHDYYTQPIKDIPIYFKPTTLFLKKCRYECPSCHKTFYPSNNIVSKYARKTNRLTEYIIHELRNLISVSDVAKKTSTSPSFISKLLPYLAVTNSKLPRVLCIDEFKGNTGNFKYQVALIDGETHEVVDILECRHKHALCQYFKKFPQEQLDHVQYLVSDLWETYKDISMTYFRKAKIVADHFHFVRYALNVVNEIRIDIQKKLPTNERKYFKHSRKLLLSRRQNLKSEQQLDELEYILINYSEELRIAYREKESLLDILHSSESSEIRKQQFNEWVKRNLESDILPLKECAKTYLHWAVEIRNSLEVLYSNGATEGFNNKIKTLKRVCFGMRNFTHFKARIMLLNRS